MSLWSVCSDVKLRGVVGMSWVFFLVLDVGSIVLSDWGEWDWY